MKTFAVVITNLLAAVINILIGMVAHNTLSYFNYVVASLNITALIGVLVYAAWHRSIR